MYHMIHTSFFKAELLIVVAIIAVLVAIAIPIFTAQLEKAREAVDLSNLRSAYAAVVVEVIGGNESLVVEVEAKQKRDGWQTPYTSIGSSLSPYAQQLSPDASTSGWTVRWDAENECVVIVAH